MTQPNPTILNRRQFLAAALTVAGGNAAVSALVGTEAPSPTDKSPAAEAKPVAQGYRETEHTQAYYRAARF